jgi:hypothetical protein
MTRITTLGLAHLMWNTCINTCILYLATLVVAQTNIHNLGWEVGGSVEASQNSITQEEAQWTEN